MEDQEEVEVEIQQLQDQVIHLPLALLKEIQVEQEFLQDLIMVQAVEVEQELLELMVLVLQQEMVELGLHPVLQLVQWLELVVVEVVLFVVLVAELEDQVVVDLKVMQAQLIQVEVQAVVLVHMSVVLQAVQV